MMYASQFGWMLHGHCLDKVNSFELYGTGLLATWRWQLASFWVGFYLSLSLLLISLARSGGGRKTSLWSSHTRLFCLRHLIAERVREPFREKVGEPEINDARITKTQFRNATSCSLHAQE